MKKKIVIFPLILSVILILLSSCNHKQETASSSISSALSESDVASGNSNSTESSEASSSVPAISASSSEENTGGGLNWGGTKLLLKSPVNGGYALTAGQTFTWSDISAESYTFYLEEKEGSGFRQIKAQAGLKDAKYQPGATLKSGTTYRWRVEAIKGGKTIKHSDSTEKGALFMAVAKNSGKDYSFDGKISEQVLKNYLSRSITFSFLAVPSGDIDTDIRFILNAGAKFISRASLPWEAETNYDSHMAYYKENIDKVHTVDSDIILEAGIYETVFKSCEQVAIPDWVFKAFEKSPENRNFSYQKMLFLNGKYVDHWGSGASVPDITQLETQMYFYYRACKYIDAGFEAMHWGQVMLIGENDTNHVNYQKVLTMVRNYAKTHARRHFVLLNGATSGMTGPDGKLLYDFHIYPARMYPAEGSIAHAPTDANPQKCILSIGYLDSIYKKSIGGTTVSGWSTSSLPYIVDIDNYDGYEKGYLNNPKRDYWPWGMDEISWFANQSSAYRSEWLNYAYSWIKNNDPAGSLCMPGSRPIYSQKQSKMTWYYANSTEFCANGFNDESVIKDIWAKN